MEEIEKAEEKVRQIINRMKKRKQQGKIKSQMKHGYMEERM